MFVDVDTQLGFVFLAGALYVPGAEQIVPRIVALNQFAAANNIQVISTADAHGENDPEFASWRPHCVVDTFGQAKVSGTVLQLSEIETRPKVDRRVSLVACPPGPLRVDGLRHCGQDTRATRPPSIDAGGRR